MRAQAPDPTNIIWENRHISKNNFLRHLVLATVSLLSILMLMFYVIYQLKKTTLANTMKYQGVNCPSIFSVYGDSDADKIKYAWIEYKADVESQGNAPMNGNLQCFCDEQFKKGKNSEDFYEFTQDGVTHKD